MYPSHLIFLIGLYINLAKNPCCQHSLPLFYLNDPKYSAKIHIGPSLFLRYNHDIFENHLDQPFERQINAKHDFLLLAFVVK